MAFYRSDGHRAMNSTAKSVPEFLERVVLSCAVRRLSLRTDRVTSYIFAALLSFTTASLKKWERVEVEAFLTHLALREGVAASTQNWLLRHHLSLP
jgi:hypothetical protein